MLKKLSIEKRAIWSNTIFISMSVLFFIGTILYIFSGADARTTWPIYVFILCLLAVVSFLLYVSAIYYSIKGIRQGNKRLVVNLVISLGFCTIPELLWIACAIDFYAEIQGIYPSPVRSFLENVGFYEYY